MTVVTENLAGHNVLYWHISRPRERAPRAIILGRVTVPSPGITLQQATCSFFFPSDYSHPTDRRQADFACVRISFLSALFTLVDRHRFVPTCIPFAVASQFTCILAPHKSIFESTQVFKDEFSVFRGGELISVSIFPTHS